MIDSHNRVIDYMRISITDRCNLRCIYCAPETVRTLPEDELLTYQEILRICGEASRLGIRFVKLTGGEPLMREGVPELVSLLKTKAGIERVTLTTNGVLLLRHLDALRGAGIDGITVSLDSLDPERFKATTGSGRLADIMAGIRESVGLNIPVKLNAVLIGGGGEPAWRDLAELAATEPLTVRFIEMMPIGYGGKFQGVSNDELLERMRKVYPGIAEDRSAQGAGPAVYYHIPGFKGHIGFISAMSHKFCRTCNRIRLTADGLLKPCLCYAGGVDVKAALRRGGSIREALLAAAALKPRSHCFTGAAPEKPTEQRIMSAIGG
ncbi:MAG: GTP 3',8-cyclase MoaA [Spirochaetaceae bacterium]|jgi:cyclic pyranopterin phosphate synthase|nr:GTP 3',8-cyclase MoaA [Spirochaetaceae bacterium]